MQQEFFTLPLRVDRIMRRLDQPRCDLQQSVRQHLHLLMTSALGEFPADEQFGCIIWDNDFDNLSSAHRIKEAIRVSLLQNIQQYEKRLDNPRVEVLIRQEELNEPGKRSVKKKIDITVSGTLHATNEKIIFRDSFFVGPLSYF